jgi:hypothetical protein
LLRNAEPGSREEWRDEKGLYGGDTITEHQAHEFVRKETVTYSSRTTITAKEYDMKMPCGTLKHLIRDREERKRAMSTKAGLKKWPETGNHKIKQKQKAKQKPSTKDIIGKKEHIARNKRTNANEMIWLKS